jgi:hypothetical protein
MVFKNDGEISSRELSSVTTFFIELTIILCASAQTTKGFDCDFIVSSIFFNA